MIPTDLVLPCRTTDPEVFFAPDGQRPGTARYIERVTIAKRLCADCPITDACREEGRERRASGVWGGEDDVEREANGFKPNKLRAVADCGTEAGATRHRRAGEKACDRCLTAENSANRERRAVRTLERAA